MKWIILAFALINLNVLASTKSNHQSNMRKIKRNQRSVISCINKIVKQNSKKEEKIENEILKNYVTTVLYSLNTNGTTLKGSSEVLKKCKQDLKTPGSITILDNPRVEKFLPLAKAMVEPGMVCKGVKVSNVMALAFGYEVGLGASYCKLTNGKNWLALVPNFGLVYGVGGFLTIDGFMFGVDNILNTPEPTLDTGYAIGLAFKGGFSLPKEGNTEDYSINYGLGVGVGFFLGASSDVPFKVVPMLPSYSRIVKQVLKVE